MRTIIKLPPMHLREQLTAARLRAEHAARDVRYREVWGECSHCEREALWYTGTSYVPALCAEHWSVLQLSRRPFVGEDLDAA